MENPNATNDEMCLFDWNLSHFLLCSFLISQVEYLGFVYWFLWIHSVVLPPSHFDFYLITISILLYPCNLDAVDDSEENTRWGRDEPPAPCPLSSCVSIHHSITSFSPDINIASRYTWEAGRNKSFRIIPLEPTQCFGKAVELWAIDSSNQSYIPSSTNCFQSNILSIHTFRFIKSRNKERRYS